MLAYVVLAALAPVVMLRMIFGLWWAAWLIEASCCFVDISTTVLPFLDVCETAAWVAV